jgi:TonB family protein
MTMTLALAIVATLSAAPQQAIQSALPATATPSTSFARVYAADTPGLVLPVASRNPFPRYTPEAVNAKVQGSIELEITVGLDGRVRDAMVVKSLDALYGMDDSAVSTVSQWVFEPARLDGKAVSARSTVTFTVTLR